MPINSNKCLPKRLVSMILFIAIEISSMKIGWNFDKPVPNKGIKKDNLNKGSKPFKNWSPPPNITPGLIIIEFFN